MKRACLILVILLAACAPPSAGQATSSPVDILPYATRTPSPAPEQPEGLIIFLETPLPSPTPSVYEVQSGDTLSGIAHKFGVSLDELMALNPDVSPNSMPIGTELKVPAPSARTSAASTPTPAPASVKQIICHPTADSGVWCFALVANELAAPLENLSAQVTLLGADGETLATALALSPLDILPPGASLPLAVFFPPPLPADIRPQAQLLTGILLSADDARYLPAVVQNTLVQVDASGRSAQVSGTVRLPAESQPARLVWVAATAYDRAGQVIGVRRWESTDNLAPGGELPFDFLVASAGGQIERVEFAVEARP
jgi:hypothetical protein